MKLEFRYSISPKPEFYSTIRLAALSLHSLGSPYDGARLIVSVGDCAELADICADNRWSAGYPVVWRSVSHDDFRKRSYLATDHDRYVEPSDADVVVLSDSDLCLVGRMDELFERLARPGRRAVAGLQAHVSPFLPWSNNPVKQYVLRRFMLIRTWSAARNNAEWRRIFVGAGLGEPQLLAQYSNDTDDVMGRSPPYFNYGMVAFSRNAFDAVAAVYESYCRLSRALTNNSIYQTQVGLSLCIAAERLAVEFLSHAYNCANDDAPFEAPDGVKLNGVDKIRVIHFLRKAQLDRRRFLTDPDAYAAFLSASGLNRVNGRLREHIIKLNRHNEMLFHQTAVADAS